MGRIGLAIEAITMEESGSGLPTPVLWSDDKPCMLYKLYAQYTHLHKYQYTHLHKYQYAPWVRAPVRAPGHRVIKAVNGTLLLAANRL